ncbi:ankyrin [Karstenula rhodostoma CBS 690.94]|uniref:Ankyrin n=1 Tax=Karstenula rhodostoma CBS 690.94 TaxID=1392251 RepID=A0A9P4PWT8_9PLEO|nr:ankyrin [Karstenula rhodostoma CBS 690.94]
MTLNQFRPLALDVARIATYSGGLEAPYAASLDSISEQLINFYNFIEDRLGTLSRGDLVLGDHTAATTYGYPVSGSLTDEKLQTIRKRIHGLQDDGRYGSAYFLKHHHLQHFPHQFTAGDREGLDTIAKGYMDLLKSEMSRRILGFGAPESFWSFVQSPLLPHMFLRNHGTKFLPGETRTDCLGRSISHVMHDHQLDGSKATWRDEDLHHVDILGRTAMFCACQRGSLAFMERLYSAGADISIPLATGMCPLHVAAVLGFTPICTRICEDAQLRQGIENIMDCTSRTSVMSAASADKYEIVDLFFQSGLVPNDPNHTRRMFVEAASKGHLKTVKVLIKHARALLAHGIEYYEEALNSAMFDAKYLKPYDIVALLPPTMKFDYNTRNDRGRTDLAEAAARGDTDEVEFLLGLNRAEDICIFETSIWTVDPNAQDDEKKSPLILAAERGMKHVIKLLLAPSLIPTIRRNDFIWARSIAKKSGDLELCNIINQGFGDRHVESFRDCIFQEPQDEGLLWPQNRLDRAQFLPPDH